MLFGNPETTTGGRALKFYSSIRLHIRRIQSIKEGDGVVGSRTRAKVVKNKVAAPFREAEFDIIYGEGISADGDLIDLGVTRGVLEKSGTWIRIRPSDSARAANARQFLKENKDIRAKLDTELRKQLGHLNVPVPENGNSEKAAADASKTVAHAAPGATSRAAAEAPKPMVHAAAVGAAKTAAKPTR